MRDENKNNLVDDELLEEASSSLIIDSKSEAQQIKEMADQIDELVDKKASDAVKKLKSADKNIKIKLTFNPKEALKTLDKEIPDMISNANKYTKGTIFGKTSLVASGIAGWTVPVLIPIPGASEMLFTASEVGNFILEYIRRWKGSSRSAINDFVNKCEKRSEELSAQEILAGREQMKCSGNILKILKYYFKTLSSIISDAMISIESKMIKAVDKSMYQNTKKLGGAIDKHTNNAKTIVGKKVNEAGNKLSDVSSDLHKDAQIAIKAADKFKKIKKKNKNKSVQESVQDLKIMIYESEMNKEITSEERAFLIEKVNVLL